MTTGRLYPAWTRLGALFAVEPATSPVWPDTLLVETFGAARDDARLFIMAASWARKHGDLVDTRSLARAVRGLDRDSRAVAGLFAELVIRGGGEPRHWEPVQRAARRRAPHTALYRFHEARAALLTLVREGAAPIGLRWGWWVNPDDLVFKDDAIVERESLLERVPELRLRTLLGEGLDARLLMAAAEAPRSIRALSRAVGATYAGTHRAVRALERRGLVAADREDLAVNIRPSAFAQRWLLPASI